MAVTSRWGGAILCNRGRRHVEWDQLAATGEACIAPLVEVAATDSGCFDDETRRQAARALEAAVERLPSTLPEITFWQSC